MPRSYKRKLGSRRYRDYTDQQLESALQKVTDEGWSLRKASKIYKIPYGTLNNKYHGRHIRSSGGQSVFTFNEEKSIIKCATTCGEWGFPLNMTDLRHLAKNLLDTQGRTVSKFSNNNLPGVDWIYSLLNRHKDSVSQRVAANIKKVRADVSRDILIEYFNNLAVTLDDVPASNIYNYDETNLMDDPGKNKLLYHRGVKYPERVCNFTKSSTSIMMCGSAAGVLLPPYIIYRAEKMWTQWTENGPKLGPCCTDRCCAAGARYNRTSHGWMDAETFTDWFKSSFLPHAKRQEGRKILIGDNLASHFTEEVIRLCQENNIRFVCLPKNATHLCQPLDVGFFRPFKMAWRGVLLEWKKTHPTLSSIDKKDFPHLLQSTLKEMDSKLSKEKEPNAIKRILMSSFNAAGIFPLNPDRVLEKLPREECVEGQMQHVLVDYLKQQRYSAVPSRRSNKRTKLVVEPGKSVTAQRSDSSSSESDVMGPVTNDNSDDDCDPENIFLESNEESEYLEVNMDQIKEGTYLLVKVLGGMRKTVSYRYVAIVQKILLEENAFEVLGMKSMDGTKLAFRTEAKDEFVVDLEDVIAVLPEPRIDSSRDSVKYVFKKSVDVKEI